MWLKRLVHERNCGFLPSLSYSVEWWPPCLKQPLRWPETEASNRDPRECAILEWWPPTLINLSDDCSPCPNHEEPQARTSQLSHSGLVVERFGRICFAAIANPHTNWSFKTEDPEGLGFLMGSLSWETRKQVLGSAQFSDLLPVGPQRGDLTSSCLFPYLWRRVCSYLLRAAVGRNIGGSRKSPGQYFFEKRAAGFPGGEF